MGVLPGGRAGKISSLDSLQDSFSDSSRFEKDTLVMA